MSEYLHYLPYFLYACPFVVAVIVLLKARLDERRPVVEETPVADIITPDDPMMTEVRSRPIHRQYVSYGI